MRTFACGRRAGSSVVDRVGWPQLSVLMFPTRETTRESGMIVLGIILLLIGFIAKVAIL